MVIDKEYAGYIIISDELKDDTIEAVNKLYETGIKNITVLTGDNKYATYNSFCFFSNFYCICKFN